VRSAVILAGGGSRRLGREKALLEFEGKPLLCWTMERLQLVADEVIVVARSEEHARRLGELAGCGSAALVWDSVEGFGPVAGLYAGMSRAGGDLVFATACDLPFLSPKVVEKLFLLAEGSIGYDAAVPQHPNEYVEPLHSVYSRVKMKAACQRAIKNGERRIRAPLEELCINHVSVERLRSLDEGLLTFFNLNTPLDLERARRLWPKSDLIESR